MKQAQPPIIVMGVAGCGKTTIGQAMAERLGRTFLDADDFHPPANRQRMSQGLPLRDEDRWPWLQRLNHRLRQGDAPVLACSALRHAYRQTLAENLQPPPLFLYLHLSENEARLRMQSRSGHFMPPSLIASQFQTLETPDPGEALHVDATLPPQRIVEQVCAHLHHHVP